MSLQSDINAQVSAIGDELVKLRRNFHQIAELAFKETETAEEITRYLASIGVTPAFTLAKTGIVVKIDGTKAGAGGGDLLIRADIDALPIAEQSGAEFAAQNGNMHACGHDGHIAIALGLVRILNDNRDKFGGTAWVLFQPAEELGMGALAMINEGLFDKMPMPGKVLALHLISQVPVGEVIINPDTVFAAASTFNIKITGRGGHAAIQHELANPIVSAANFITTAQSVIGCHTKPDEMRVLAFGKVIGGSASNVIPDTVDIAGTTRTYSDQVYSSIISSVERVLENVCQANDTSGKLEIESFVPAVANDSETAEWLAGVCRSIDSVSSVAEVPPLSYADDFSEFTRRIPGVYFLLGAGGPDYAQHHTDTFTIDEDALALGVEIFAHATFDYLS